MDIETADAMEKPAISIAAYSKDPAALRRELTRGAAVDLESPWGQTALQIVSAGYNQSLEGRVSRFLHRSCTQQRSLLHGLCRC